MERTKTTDFIGTVPGQQGHIGVRHVDKLSVKTLKFSQSEFSITESAWDDDLTSRSDGEIIWVKVTGLHEPDKIRAITTQFGLHPLEVEDVLNTQHRPKVELSPDHLFLSMRSVHLDKALNAQSIQLSVFLGDGWVLSFHERDKNMFEPLFKRLEDPNSRMRTSKADYLFYRIADLVVDRHFLVTEAASAISDHLEEEVFVSTERDLLVRIQTLKKHVSQFRRSTMALRDSLHMFQKEEVKLIERSTMPYLRDLYEHVLQVSESLDAQRDILTNILGLYHTEVSNRMNQVMQVLTIMASIFIPLTFIAGIYGMNFERIPELSWENGYFYAIGLMGVIAIGMVLYFKKKRWL